MSSIKQQKKEDNGIKGKQDLKKVTVEVEKTGLVSIVIATFNQIKYTLECIESIRKYTRYNYELIIVDNASSDETVKLFSEDEDIVLIVNKGNYGFPAGANQGIKAAKGEYVLLLNNDTVLTEGWLENLIKAAESDQKIGIVGPISNEVSGFQKDGNANYKTMDEMHKYAKKIYSSKKGEIVNFPRVAFLCTLIKRKVIDRIGGLDERFSPGNYEDDDFCLRAQLAGFKTVIAKDTFIHHYGSKSFKAEGVKKYSDRLETNKNIFIDKWGATPDEIWLQNKTINARQYFFPLNNNSYNEGIERARVNIKDKEYNLALKNFEHSISVYENSMAPEAQIPIVELLNLAGNIAIILNDLDKAKQFFENALQLNPVSSSACAGLAEIFFINDQFYEAKAMYEWGIKNDNTNQQAIEGLKKVNEILELDEEDNSLLKEEIKQSSVQDILNDALVFFEEENLQGAIEYLESVEEKLGSALIEMNVQDDIAAFYNMKGFIYLGLKELDNAQFNFEQALNNNASSSQACLGLGEIFLLNEQLNSAKIMFEWGVKNNPKNSIAVEALSKVEKLISNSESKI